MDISQILLKVKDVLIVQNCKGPEWRERLFVWDFISLSQIENLTIKDLEFVMQVKHVYKLA